jgi:hypothetical protein
MTDQSERPNGDEVLECGCRYEDREVPYAQEFVPEIDCPIHGIAGTRYTVIAIASGVRLSAGSTVLDLSHTDAEALGSVLKAIARENRDRDPVARMRSDRDALTAAINILHRPLDNA